MKSNIICTTGSFFGEGVLRLNPGPSNANHTLLTLKQTPTPILMNLKNIWLHLSGEFCLCLPNSYVEILTYSSSECAL
jgi:hypothetical protein